MRNALKISVHLVNVNEAINFNFQIDGKMAKKARFDLIYSSIARPSENDLTID